MVPVLAFKVLHMSKGQSHLMITTVWFGYPGCLQGSKRLKRMNNCFEGVGYLWRGLKIVYNGG